MLCLCLLGPPGVGKSTAALRLKDEAGWELFRLRSRVLPEKFTSSDGVSYDWLDHSTVIESLHQGVVDAAHAGAPAMVFDNFPGSEVQAQLMLELSQVLKVDIVLEIVRLWRRWDAGASKSCTHSHRITRCFGPRWIR